MNRIAANYREIQTGGRQNGFHNGAMTATAAKPCNNAFANKILAAQSDALLPHLKTVYLDNKDFIYQSGELIREIYFPENAVISEIQMLEDGRTSELAMIGREGLTGLEVVLNSGKASHWMRVSVAGSALKIKADVFKNEFDTNAGFREVILDYLHRYFRQTAQKAICNSFHLIENRLCSWLLMLADRSGKNKITVTQEQLAYFIGVQRPTITHITQGLRRRKIISYKRGEVHICDLEKLENAACSCYVSINDEF